MAAKQLRRLIADLDKMKLETPSREVGDSTRPSSQAHQPGNRVETSSPPEFAGDAAAPSAPKTMETSTAAASAKRLREFWHGVSLGSEMNVGSLTIDLGSPEGRWQLLLLAVLRGARVRERVVEETFVAIVESGLSDIRQLALGTPAIRAGLIEVLAEKYRALGHREAKADALMANAALLQEEYEGDLHTLYLAHRGEPEALIRALQRFKQIGQVAYWICRTLKVHGVWPDLSPAATQFFDRYTDLPLRRLGLMPGLEEERSGSGVMRFVTKYFQGDVIPLYLHGLVLCSQDRVSICHAECPLVAECGFPQKAE